MKKFSLLLVLAFLLMAVGTYPVLAQDQAPQYGYIPLLSEGYDTSMPREMASREIYNRLLGKLLDARRQGIITDFEPDFYGGYVKVTLANGGDAGQVGAMQILTDFEQAYTPPPAQNRDQQGGMDGVATPSVSMRLYSDCFEMRDIGANSNVKGTVTSSGKIVGYVVGSADADGFFAGCFVRTKIIPGYLVKLQTFNTSGTLLKTFYTYVPKMTILTVDKTQAIVTGTAPAGKAFRAYWYHENLDAGRTVLETNLTGTVPSTWGWKVDFGAQKMRGGDTIEFTLPNYSTYFNFYTSMILPRIWCETNSNHCVVDGFPNKAVSMSITHAGTKYSFSGKSDWGGYFGVDLVDSNQEPIFLAVGDVVTGTGATTFTIPLVTAVPYPAYDKVIGKAPKYTFFSTWVGNLSTNTWDGVWAYSNSTGKYISDYSGRFDIPADLGQAGVWHMDKITGNAVLYLYWIEK